MGITKGTMKRRPMQDSPSHHRRQAPAVAPRTTQPAADRAERLQGGSRALPAADETEKDGVS